MSISLIANTGIQFHKFYVKINPAEKPIKPIGFFEDIDILNGTGDINYACYLPEQDVWVKKKDLVNEDCIDENEKLLYDEITKKINVFKPLKEEEYYTINDIGKSFKFYENYWLPIPFFKKNNLNKFQFGPLAWTRMMIKKVSITDTKAEDNTHIVILAFDTKCDDSNTIYFAPRTYDTSETDNIFALSNDDGKNLDFINEMYHCGWVEEYLLYIAHKGVLPEEYPMFKYISTYIYMIKYLEAKKVFPDVVFYSDNNTPVDVDLVLDIGNSNTCGLLFESPIKDKSFRFTSVKKLKLQDLSDPEKEYDEAFSMRLAFVESRFGDFEITDYKNCFKWPSLLRIGTEAAKLINLHNLDNDKGKETSTSHSSPKRYLWDEEKNDVQWEFISNHFGNEINGIYFTGISQQFKENGEFTDSVTSSASIPCYSRKSLMTFVYMELILQALTQINSNEFRNFHGNPDKPRKLKRITITCPTAIVQKEQIALRELAVTAIKALKRFFPDNLIEQDLEIIPSPKDLGKDLSLVEFRTDWIYDEATCSQLVYLYAEISKRYLNNSEKFFNLYGKKRNDVTNSSQKAVTIGTIDIGGGTTDLMICAYQCDAGQSIAVIKPHPLYWESFITAGDDLLKNVVQEIVLEGKIEKHEEKGCRGVIENYVRDLGCIDVAKHMNYLFGTDSNTQPYLDRIKRKNFIVQIAVPIALRYLQHAIDDKEDTEISFNELFPEIKPNPELIKYYNDYFTKHCSKPFKLEDIRWKLSKQRVKDIVNTTFDPLLKQLCALMSAYGCDFVILAGKPTTIPAIREIIVKYYPVSPDRLISMNDYRVGRWYPFHDEIGHIQDTKTIVSVGALVALMGGKLNKLEGFKIDTELLKQKLISTAEYIGVLNPVTKNVEIVYFNKDTPNITLKFEGKTIIGYKQLPNKTYPGRAIYKMDLADEEYKQKLQNRMPLHISIERDYSQSKEKLTITEVTDKNENPVSKSAISFSLLTMPDEYGYWLDTGEFKLNIK